MSGHANAAAPMRSIWAPISESGPTVADLKQNEGMLEFLTAAAPEASKEDREKREKALRVLEGVIGDWLTEVGVQQGMTAENARKQSNNGKLFTFGSHRLGLISPSSDIDCLCVAPRHVTREAFFGSLVGKLQQMDEVETVTPVPDAYAPIIKLICCEVDIDLLFARLNLTSTYGLKNLQSDELLKNLDDRSVRCVNGTRVADMILKLVPTPNTFRGCLRLIKLWAKRRGLYANIIGFFGGITWALLVARVCQMFPNMQSVQLVRRFFLILSRWNWDNPVTLCPIRQSNEIGLMSFKVWNPKQYASDRSHLMPVITPAFPSMNSTYNVTETTKRIIMGEIERAHKLTMLKKDNVDWELLCHKFPFFCNYLYYVQIRVSALSSTAYRKYKGFVESRLRLLVRMLENTPGIKSVRPWPEEMPYVVDGEVRENSCCWYIGLDFPKLSSMAAGQTVTCDLRNCTSGFFDRINEWSEKDTYHGQFEMDIAYLSRPKLPEHLTKDQSPSTDTAPVPEIALQGIKRGAQTGLNLAARPNKRRHLDLDVSLKGSASR
ncbi:hypothetical protein FOZ60_007769 [Perkinsus olseni]|uniref:Poly(A) polymerase n=3 Tax=Perkinsus olseni TaxID=32597 RepID=A0A7J6PEA4_PEROL|nr:hypothetical protein FOZ60_007769 [Perkinsus olseni]